MAILRDIFSGFLTTMKGMVVTGKEFFQPGITVQYPYKKREYPERMRGMLVNDTSLCMACGRCIKVCPVDCLAMETEGKGKERRPVVFTIDYVKCCWCALCCEVCPVESLYMSHDIETVFTDRRQMIRDFCKDPAPSKKVKVEEPVVEEASTEESEKETVN
jgi:NADH-quinone oxidoreductase subunit I